MLPENVAYEVTRILHDNIAVGTGDAAYTGCDGQAGKTGTTDRQLHRRLVHRLQPEPLDRRLGRLPESNAIEMTRVHGITVAGGTFPAEIWHAFYTKAGCPAMTSPSPRADPVVLLLRQLHLARPHSCASTAADSKKGGAAGGAGGGGGAGQQ